MNLLIICEGCFNQNKYHLRVISARRLKSEKEKKTLPNLQYSLTYLLVLTDLILVLSWRKLCR